jgi:hypothetical protein
MAKLSELFVLVKTWDEYFNFFDADYHAPTLEEAQQEADERNKKERARFPKSETYQQIVFWVAMPWKEAIEAYTDKVADSYTEHDESY